VNVLTHLILTCHVFILLTLHLTLWKGFLLKATERFHSQNPQYLDYQQKSETSDSSNADCSTLLSAKRLSLVDLSCNGNRVFQPPQLRRSLYSLLSLGNDT